MTVVDDPAADTLPAPTEVPEGGASADVGPSEVGAPVAPPVQDLLEPRRLVALVLLFVVVIVVATFVVIYCIGPLIQARQQRSLISAERAAIGIDAKANEGLYRPKLPTQPPAPGSLVGILAIRAIGLEQAVVEGVGPSETASGPGHVPGTAGLGQPGNAAVVGRRGGFGGSFGNLGQLKAGDHIVTATTEGQSVYIVRSVRHVILTTTGTPAATTTTSTPSTPATSPPGPLSPTTTRRESSKAEAKVSLEKLYGPTAANQMTLVTSGSAAPWNTAQAVVVVARLHGLPYTPVPQESRSTSQQGNSGDPDALAWLLLDLLALAAILLGAVYLYRRVTLRSAYLLTTAPLLVFTILAAEAMSRLLPAWL